MKRRSKRLRSAAGRDGSVNINIDDHDVDKVATLSDVASKKGSKVEKSTESSRLRRVKGRRGQLEEISRMPLDILYEIFLQLDPIDILSLSRVSKSLRKILMRRSSTYIWKNARARIPGLPECPIDMSEPAYANLAFYPYCQFCLKAYVSPGTILWGSRTKACKNCFAEHFEHYPNDFPDNVMPSEMILNDRGVAYIVNKDTLRQYLAEWKGLQGTALDEWCTRKQSEQKIREEHADKCKMWNKTRNRERSDELDNLRGQRYQAIKAKLSDLGWGEEIFHLENSTHRRLFLGHKLINQPKVLTERIWGNIKDVLIDFLEKAKARRLDKLRRDTRKKRGKILS
ncbi:hypothetical protein J132_04007 [Termitomyces sp. J132]|nr:hypothetical protein H2248_010027 [Termitomyces sp. 'cryptogamus']KNZ72317.1 hypothetical protein J132_04007 [Termitomyces sp. J132]